MKRLRCKVATLAGVSEAGPMRMSYYICTNLVPSAADGGGDEWGLFFDLVLSLSLDTALSCRREVVRDTIPAVGADTREGGRKFSLGQQESQPEKMDLA